MGVFAETSIAHLQETVASTADATAPGAKSESRKFEAEIQERLTGNIMEVGNLGHWNLKELCKRKGIRMPAEIEMLLDDFDFYLIQSAFSCMPAQDNQFKWARIVAKMEPLSENMKNPIAYDAYPRDIYEEKKEKHRLSIGLSLKFAEIIEPKAECVEEIEFTRLVPLITIAGIGRSEPTWNFSERAAFNLKDGNTFYIIVKTPIKSEGIKVSYFSFCSNKYQMGRYNSHNCKGTIKGERKL